MKYKYSFVIPCYNEELTVNNVVSNICDMFSDSLVVVVDDGSKDKSINEIEKIKVNNLHLIKLEKNMGKGFALRKGLDYVIDKSEIVIFTDADNEILLKDLSLIRKSYENNEYSVIFGSRFLDMGIKEKLNMGIHRFIANSFLTKFANFVYKQQLTDMETAVKSFKTEIGKKLNLKSDRFEIEPEIVKEISHLNIKIFEIPIDYKPRTTLEGKKISTKDGFYTLKFLFRSLINYH